MFRPPRIPCFAIAVQFYQHPEEGVISQPRLFCRAECGEGLAGFGFGLYPRPEYFECAPEQFILQRFDDLIVDPAAAQRGEIDPRGHFGEGLPRQIFRRARREVQRGRVDRARANRVVGAVVGAGFVDRQELDELETDRARPVDELPQAGDIADAKVVRGPEGEERDEHTGDAVGRRKIHREKLRPQMKHRSKDESLILDFAAAEINQQTDF